MYADDHRPPHPDFQALVRIADFAVIAGEATQGGIAEALQWAREHQDMLVRKWAELNQRG
jgi:hypothetical protein